MKPLIFLSGYGITWMLLVTIPFSSTLANHNRSESKNTLNISYSGTHKNGFKISNYEGDPVPEAEYLRHSRSEKPPNIILIFCDDLGYGDLSGYGSVWNQTPEIDRMMSEGLRFTNFYAGAPVCTPSRAGLMTGAYARRVDLDLDIKNRWVLFPKATKGINPEEKILTELLRDGGYATAIIGKWHLGDQQEFFPMNHGFDFWYGLPYSNDMGVSVDKQPLLPMMKNWEVVEQIKGGWKNKEEQSTITQKYTDAAIAWIDEKKTRPFFLYLSHTMPHAPMEARKPFHQKTNHPNTSFGGSVAEISWSTGKILDYLKEENLAENTLVIFTSDNGGARRLGSSNGILRGSKGQVYEGGIRVPFIAWWPGKIEQGSTCHEFASVLDILPTFANLANMKVENNKKRDGLDISGYLFDPGKRRESRPYFYWHAGYLMAVRYGDWKLNLLGGFSDQERKNILKSTYNLTQFPEGIELYDLRKDPGEAMNIAEDFPEVVEMMRKMAAMQITALGQYDQYGPEVRKTRYIQDPVTIFE
jgi:arylsulfatase A-like enzyme